MNREDEETGTEFPPRCQGCGKKLQPMPAGCLPCPTCPPGTHVVYYMQKGNKNGYPAGWPICTWCGEPVIDGKPTCGNLVCRVKERESHM